MGTKTKTEFSVSEVDVRSMTDEQLGAELDQLNAALEDVAKLYKSASAAYEEWRRERDEAGRKLSRAAEDAHRLFRNTKDRISAIAGERLRRTTPFDRGDIVEDDQGVRYRVHRVVFRDFEEALEVGKVYGIRLTKTGTEAYAKPREIVSSSPLKKVEG